MKPKPIIFRGPMVRAILEGRKTMARWVLSVNQDAEISGGVPELRGNYQFLRLPNGNEFGPVKCPYLVGDVLWVRERFYVAEYYSYGTLPCGDPIPQRGVPRGPVHYAADGEPSNTPNRHYPKGLRNNAYAAPDPYAIWILRPSIHMPYWACRLWLRVTDVRVERVREISEADAMAEGSFLGRCSCMPRKQDKTPMECAFHQTWCHIHGDEFSALWDSINAKRGFPWASNPWVWVIQFERIEKPESEKCND